MMLMHAFVDSMPVAEEKSSRRERWRRRT